MKKLKMRVDPTIVTLRNNTFMGKTLDGEDTATELHYAININSVWVVPREILARRCGS